MICLRSQRSLCAMLCESVDGQVVRDQEQATCFCLDDSWQIKHTLKHHFAVSAARIAALHLCSGLLYHKFEGYGSRVITRPKTLKPGNTTKPRRECIERWRTPYATQNTKNLRKPSRSELIRSVVQKPVPQLGLWGIRQRWRYLKSHYTPKIISTFNLGSIWRQSESL